MEIRCFYGKSKQRQIITHKTYKHSKTSPQNARAANKRELFLRYAMNLNASKNFGMPNAKNYQDDKTPDSFPTLNLLLTLSLFPADTPHGRERPCYSYKAR